MSPFVLRKLERGDFHRAKGDLGDPSLAFQTGMNVNATSDHRQRFRRSPFPSSEPIPGVLRIRYSAHRDLWTSQRTYKAFQKAFPRGCWRPPDPLPSTNFQFPFRIANMPPAEWFTDRRAINRRGLRIKQQTGEIKTVRGSRWIKLGFSNRANGTKDVC